MRYNVDWKRRLVHEVLADQYIQNPNHYETIDHVDCNKLNNSITNLEWVTREENKKRAYDNGLTCVIKTLVTFTKIMIHLLCWDQKMLAGCLILRNLAYVQ